MKTKLIASIVAVGALTLSACSSTQKANPCAVWAADLSPYLTQFKAAPGADPACVAKQVTTAGQTFDGHYAYISAQQYPQPDGSMELAFLPFDVSFNSLDPDTTERLPGTTVALGTFSTAEADSNQECMVPSTSASSTAPSGATADYSMTFKNLKFLEDAKAMGTVFTGTASVTTAGCTADYTITALAPGVARCASDTDCLPTTDVSTGRFASGIANHLHTFCDLSPDTAAFNESYYENWLATKKYPTLASAGLPSGICFLADPYPSICKAGYDSVEGGPGSACPVGK